MQKVQTWGAVQVTMSENGLVAASFVDEIPQELRPIAAAAVNRSGSHQHILQSGTPLMLLEQQLTQVLGLSVYAPGPRRQVLISYDLLSITGEDLPAGREDQL